MVKIESLEQFKEILEVVEDCRATTTSFRGLALDFSSLEPGRTIPAVELATVIRCHSSQLEAIELKHVALEDGASIDVVLQAIAKCTHLRAFSFVNELKCHSMPEWRAVCQSIQSLPKLEHLKLILQDDQLNPDNTEILKIMAQSIRQMGSKLKTLEVQVDTGLGDGQAGADFLTQVASACPLLKVLRFHSIGQIITSSALASLQKLRHLKAVHLCVNQIDPEALEELIRQNNPCLQHFDLVIASNDLQEAHKVRLDGLAQALEHNYTLQDLNIRGDFGQLFTLKDCPGALMPTEEALSEWSAKIGFYLMLNQLERSKLMKASADNAWIDFVIDNKDVVALTFFALQAKPTLCQRVCINTPDRANALSTVAALAFASY